MVECEGRKGLGCGVREEVVVGERVKEGRLLTWREKGKKYGYRDRVTGGEMEINEGNEGQGKETEEVEKYRREGI